METIKKYENRKLYSLQLNKYVDLRYINDLVKTSQKFQVIDNKTQDDITTKTMMTAMQLLKLDRKLIETIVRGI